MSAKPEYAKLKYEESIPHGNEELPIALHKTDVLPGTNSIFNLHWHQEYEFLYMNEGSCIITVEGRKYELQKHDALFINSNFLHKATSFNQHACSFTAIVFKPTFLTNSTHNNIYARFIQPIIKGEMKFTELIKDSSVLNILGELVKSPDIDISADELHIKAQLMEVWNLMLKSAIITTPSELWSKRNQAERFKPVFDYIRQNYGDDISLDSLAVVSSLSKSQFCRSFANIMGISPFTYLNNYRITVSCNYLTDTDKKIAEIANLVGFNNISYYNREFKKIIGCTPTEYRSRK